MARPNPFDSAHVQGSALVGRFLEAMLRAGELPSVDARRHADNAYVLVEFLANTYPKLPDQANERDVWVFLFDYYISQGPFQGPAVPMAPLSVRLFFEFAALERRVPELHYLREACTMGDFFTRRVASWGAISKAAEDGSVPPEELDEMVAAWQDELTAAMRPRGLVPDASMARGEGPWGADMGPLEAAVFDAVCVVLSHAARELARRGVTGEAAEERMVGVQDRFMRANNPGLGVSPLEAIRREREAVKAASPAEPDE